MKRKTNLFNLNAFEDTLFLTFSNYTEYLTGNFLSTNTKMYPSSFLCFNLPFENNDYIIEFKRYLMQYYENKLTALRACFVKDDNDPEENLSPLFYLLDAIDNFFENLDVNIVYAGDIVEQDYNGTYSDSICIINLNNGYNITTQRLENSDRGKIVIVNKSDETLPERTIDTENINALFGWKNEEISNLFENDIITPIYDENDSDGVCYNIGSKIKQLDIEPINSDSNNRDIEFNCVIPLFDIRNINSENISKNTVLEFDDCKRSNIPLGIWISPEVIKVSKYAGHAQSWSLVVGSKFSPLPYSSANTIDDNNSFDASIVKDMIYLTYSELLANHANLQNKYNEALNTIQNLETKVRNIENQLSSLILQSNLEKISEMIDNKFVNLQNEFNSKMKLIEEYIANLKWKYIN